MASWLALTLGLCPDIAFAGPPVPAPAQEIEIVPQFLEGQVRLFLAGREGDDVYVDGWLAGQLPVVTELAEGLHRFRVEGAAGKLEREVYVTVKPKVVLDVDLAVVPPPPPIGGHRDPPSDAPAPAPKPVN